MPSDDGRSNDLPLAMNKMGVNQVCLTPTVAAFLSPDLVPGLRTLSVGGEAFQWQLLDRWQDHVDMINVYGPAECSMWCVIQTDLEYHSTQPSIGRGVGCLTWIVSPNDHDRLAPIGAEGELLIKGLILARGYLNNPDKTMAFFIENPG